MLLQHNSPFRSYLIIIPNLRIDELLLIRYYGSLFYFFSFKRPASENSEADLFFIFPYGVNSIVSEIHVPPCPISVQSVMLNDTRCPAGSAEREGATTVADSPGSSTELIEERTQAFTSWNPSNDEFFVSFVTVSLIDMEIDLNATGPLFDTLIRVHQEIHLPELT